MSDRCAEAGLDLGGPRHSGGGSLDLLKTAPSETVVGWWRSKLVTGFRPFIYI